MGILDNLLKTGGSGSPGLSQGTQSSLANGILEMLGNQQSGGLQGLVQAFTQKGMGDIVSSWIGTGPNLPVSGEQIQSALGNDTVNALAQKAGLAPAQTRSALAQLLPAIVDKLTPQASFDRGSMAAYILSTRSIKITKRNQGSCIDRRGGEAWE